MKKRFIYPIFYALVAMFLFGCGGDGGSSSGGSGTLSMDIADAKPLIAGDPTEVWLIIDEVLVHKSGGGGWISLPFRGDTPYRVNLMQHQNGASVQLIPPVKLDPGKYTQIRFVISNAYMVIGGNAQNIELTEGDQNTDQLDIPSGILKTDRQFSFDLEDGEWLYLTVDVDLSQSIVATGQPDSCQFKPVLHITKDAAMICGSIAAATFDTSEEANVTVISDKNGDGNYNENIDEVYTQVLVDKVDQESSTEEVTNFCIYWLVPEKDYIVRIDVDGSEVYSEALSSVDLASCNYKFRLNDLDEDCEFDAGEEI